MLKTLVSVVALLSLAGCVSKPVPVPVKLSALEQCEAFCTSQKQECVGVISHVILPIQGGMSLLEVPSGDCLCRPKR